ncbi:MAG: trypsin-like peptidase domain-containing protein [Candidatus Roizmanbacteria bacterium]|nr:trypsin-like peptidase domain-containing protein [Candidatus Roizmanbacteria bacterium]
MKFITALLLIIAAVILGLMIARLDIRFLLPKNIHNSDSTSSSSQKKPAPILETDTSSCNEQNMLTTVKRCTVMVLRDDGGHGTGFSIRDGFVVTNKHVIEGAHSLYIITAGQKQKVSLWNYSPTFDIAVLKLPQSGLIPTCTWQDSSTLALAESLYAIGWPNEPGGDSTITKGIFSRINHYESGLEFIQTDAPLNPGNSGGPLVNKCGVIGVVTAKESWSNEKLPRPLEGLGNALSSHLVAPLVNNLIAEGKDTTIPNVTQVASSQSSSQSQVESIDVPEAKAQLDIDVLKKYLSQVKDARTSWEKGYDYLSREEVDPLIDSLNRQIVFCETLISRLESNSTMSQDDLFMWDSVVRMSQESVALSKALNEKINK